MQIFVNGQSKEIEQGLNIRQLVETLALKAGRVAVERNREIIGRIDWDSVTVEEGDRYEIVTFVGGG